MTIPINGTHFLYLIASRIRQGVFDPRMARIAQRSRAATKEEENYETREIHEKEKKGRFSGFAHFACFVVKNGSREQEVDGL